MLINLIGPKLDNLVIEAINLYKNYESFNKKEGFRGSLLDFFNRKKIVVPAVNNVTLEVKEGEILGIIGKNGAGKSTLLKLISGLIAPSKGKILVFNQDPSDRNPTFLKNLSLMSGQKSILNWDLPPLDSLLLIKDIYGLHNDNFNKNLKYFTDLLDNKTLLNKPVRKLSLGERIKFELISALIFKPKLILLDEPTIGLDLLSQEAIRGFLKKINSDFKTTIILTSHNTQDIQLLADKILVLDKGQNIFTSSIDSLLRFKSEKIVTIVTKENIKKPSIINCKIIIIHQNSITVKIDISKLPVFLHDLSNKYTFKDIKIDNFNLENFILEIYQNRK